MNIFINLSFEFLKKYYIVFILVWQNLYLWFMIILIINEKIWIFKLIFIIYDCSYITFKIMKYITFIKLVQIIVKNKFNETTLKNYYE